MEQNQMGNKTIKPIIFIFIDALAWKPLRTLLPRLPTFKYLMEKYKSGSYINNLEIPKGDNCGEAVAMTSFCAATSLLTGKQPIEHGMLSSAWDTCICEKENPKHNRKDRPFTKGEIKVKFIWEEIPNSVGLHTLLFPMIYYNCERPPEREFELEDTIVKFPYDPAIRFSFPEKVTHILARESVKILRDRKPSFFTCGLYGLDTMSHYNWHEPDFEELYRGYKFIDDYLRDILPFLEESWFVIGTQHGMEDWYITSGRKGSRRMGIKGVHGDHDSECPYITNMDELKEILDIYKVIMKYAKKERMLK